MIDPESDTARHVIKWAMQKTEATRAKLASPRLDYPQTQYVRGELAILTALADELSSITNDQLLIPSTSYLDDY
jgi:hypothetical protein